MTASCSRLRNMQSESSFIIAPSIPPTGPAFSTTLACAICAAARTHGALCALDPARPPLDLRFDPARVALYHERAFERGRRRADAAHARNRATGGAQNRTRHIALV